MENKNKFTPGPWVKRIAQPGTMLEIVGENREYVCSLLGSDEYKQANARLIAAAPDMLEALQDLTRCHDLKMGISAYKLRIELAKEAIRAALAE